jgi:copper chaperone CopZ
MNATPEQLSYDVPGISCGHCRTAITAEVEQVPGVRAVEVDLEGKRVSVSGEGMEDAAVRAAIDEAGYDIAETDEDPR